MTNFQNLLRNMQNQIHEDNKVFHESEDRKVEVINPEGLFNRKLNDFEEAMLRRIKKVDEYSWGRGKSGGLDTGFESFNEAIDGGIQPGLILFAASPNVGKSAFMLQLMKQIAENNENVYCEYHSLDDSLNEILPRWIACDQQITIGQAKNPEKYEDNEEILDRRNEGLKNMYRLINKFAMMDQEDSPEHVEALEDHIKELKMKLPMGTRIVIGIDSFYDLRTSKNFGGNERKEFEHIAQKVKDFCHTYDITVMATAHLRKAGNKRPINDDLKESNRLEFEANLICLLYNEVGIKDEAAEIYWHSEDDELKMPVLEVRFSKNKFSDFKGIKFFEFVNSKSYFIESSEEASRRYASLIYQN